MPLHLCTRQHFEQPPSPQKRYVIYEQPQILPLLHKIIILFVTHIVYFVTFWLFFKTDWSDIIFWVFSRYYGWSWNIKIALTLPDIQNYFPQANNIERLNAYLLSWRFYVSRLAVPRSTVPILSYTYIKLLIDWT